MELRIDEVTIRIDDITIVDGATVCVDGGSFHALVGPNGSGKSTLLRAVYRSLRPHAGRVLFDSDDVWRDLRARSAAQRRAVVTQDDAMDVDHTVLDLVTMGRTAHLGPLQREGERDRRIVRDALDQVDMAWAAHRHVDSLSGGERQRVLLARALAQQPKLLVLDEPTNHLDVRARLELLALVRQLPLTVVAALHDLDQAVALADAVTVMHRGLVVASGPTGDVLTTTLIADVFGVAAHIGPHPLTGAPHIAFAALTSRQKPSGQGSST
jgi:iron complex transport system ATP-binding protein